MEIDIFSKENSSNNFTFRERKRGAASSLALCRGIEEAWGFEIAGGDGNVGAWRIPLRGFGQPEAETGAMARASACVQAEGEAADRRVSSLGLFPPRSLRSQG